MRPDPRDHKATDAQGLVLWAGTVRRAPLQERVRAASDLGYDALSLSPADYHRARRDGVSDHEIRALIADAGLQVNCLDPYTRWLPTWEPPRDAVPRMLSFIGADEREFFAAAEAVGARSMTVFEPFGHRWPLDVLAESLAQVCTRARSSGMRVNVEFIPFLGIPDLATAWQIVQMSADPEAGIVMDTWHYFRGRPDNELLGSIPGERIGAVQVSDALPDPVGSLETDCLHHRLPARLGSFPLDEVLSTLQKTGGLHDVGPEIFSDAFDKQQTETSARNGLTGMARWQALRDTQASGETPASRRGAPATSTFLNSHQP